MKCREMEMRISQVVFHRLLIMVVVNGLEIKKVCDITATHLI